MRIVKEKPPIWDEAEKLFNLTPDQGTIFTYGNTIYNPWDVPVTDDLIRHEETHCEQQESDPAVAAIWWKRYLQDAEFRFDQEAEAFGEQYKFICQKFKDRNKRAKWLWELARQLSGPMYGSMTSHTEASKVIRDHAENKVALSKEL